MSFPQKNIFESPKFLELYQKLYKVPRTGWVDRGVENPETVGEHTDGLIALAEKWHTELGIQDLPHLQKILKIHDLAEGDEEVGDITTYHLSREEEKYMAAKELKFQKEFTAMKKIASTLGKDGDIILDLWLEFEKNETHDTQIGHELDKIHAVIKAYEYQATGQPVEGIEFVEYVERKNYVKHPFLLEKINQLKTRSH